MPGSVMPSASAMTAIVEAVPMVLQWPALRAPQTSASVRSAAVNSPLSILALTCQLKVPEPISPPRNLPFSIGPPDTTSVGRPTLQAPIKSDGVVLSQPVISTTPSSGLARSDSSTSMLARLRNSMVVGFMMVSPSDMTGNSIGTPPASRMPRLTFSASSRRWPLQGVSSLQVLQMPMTGLPPK